MRQAAIALHLLAGAASVGAAQARDVDHPQRVAWTGCWTIRMADSTPRLSRQLIVRLDTVRAPTRRGPQRYYGAGLDGFPRDGMWPFPIVWVSPAPESLNVAVISLGGHGWHLATSGDSLLGVTYEYYDIIPDETILGPATARRTPCP